MAKSTLPVPTLLDQTTGLVPDGTCFVAGLSWKVLLGLNPEKMALAESKKAKASHYVYSDKSGNVGYTKIKAVEKNTKYVSMARLFAASNPSSTVFLALSINEQQTWVCAVSNGSVLTGYDIVTSDHDVVEQLKNAIAKRFSEALFWGDISDIGLEPSFNWESLTDSLTNPQRVNSATLRTLDGGLAAFLASIPASVIWMVSISVLGSIGWKLVVPMAKKYIASRQVVVVEDPEALWWQALEDHFKAMRISAPGSLQQLAQSIEGMPTLIDGWRLQNMSCAWTAKAWKCFAKYQASSRHQTNDGFNSATPADWILSWDFLNGVTAAFDFPVIANSIDQKTMRSIGYQELKTASQMQASRPFFNDSSKPLEKFSPIKIAPPKFAKGEPVPIPPALKLPLVGAVTLLTPLRTISIMDWVDEISWKKVSISFNLKKTPGKNDSIVMLDLNGEIYAKP